MTDVVKGGQEGAAQTSAYSAQGVQGVDHLASALHDANGEPLLLLHVCRPKRDLATCHVAALVAAQPAIGISLFCRPIFPRSLQVLVQPKYRVCRQLCARWRKRTYSSLTQTWTRM